MFDAARFRVFTNDDVIGCEVAGAVKNVVALAAGMAAGLGYGRNGMGALLSQGLVEMCCIGAALGARTETFFGLAGQGDLVATCFSEQSRNHRVGVALAQGHSITTIADRCMVSEGATSRRLHRRAGAAPRRRDAARRDGPLVVDDGRSPQDASPASRPGRPATSWPASRAPVGSSSIPGPPQNDPTLPPHPRRDTNVKQLTGLDASFLYMETAARSVT